MLLISSLVTVTALLGAATAAELFHHRDFHASIVVGDYLYIDGGDITTWSGIGNGTQTSNPQRSGSIYTKPSNYTYSIDLSSSWTNSSVKLNQISKAAPPLNGLALWSSEAGDTFYAYDGGLSEAYSWWYSESVPPDNALWRFTPSGSSGTWSKVDIASSTFSSLIRVANGVFASGNGLGFALGGVYGDATVDRVFTDYTEAPLIGGAGMVVYNDTSQEWFNVSAAGYGDAGQAAYGAGLLVPYYGSQGLFFALGGVTADGYTSFNEAQMYDPASREWLTQTTTGDIPPQRQQHCVVGQKGDNATYEIFMYGGAIVNDIENTVLNGAVWVLSLPSFNWHMQDTTPDLGRWVHTCEAVGRQMISIGGAVVYSDTSSDAFLVTGGVPDPWDQGLGVFDMTTMQWTDGYDAHAKPYTTPQVIKDWYRNNGLFPNWDDAKVRTLFESATKAGLKSPASNSDTGVSSNSSSSNTGAIAGGVVGAVVAIALIAALVLFLLRRKRRRQRTPAEITGGMTRRSYGMLPQDEKRGHAGELVGEEAPNELPAGYSVQEMPAKTWRQEASSREVYELDSYDKR